MSSTTDPAARFTTRRAPAVCALLLLPALTGCGAQIAETDPEAAGSGAGHYPVTVENCGEKLTFDRAPERAVSYDVGITEIMFALGLADRMAGYAMADDRGDVEAVPWKDGYERTEWLSTSRISMELVLDADADFVFAGWNYGFGGYSGVTPDTLAGHGIASYVLTESCRPGGEGTERGVMPPLEALYTDLAALGTIFGVEERAGALIEEFREEVADARARAPKGEDRPRVFLYDDGRDAPLTSGMYAGPHDIITRAGGDHVMGDLADSWTTVGWETVVERDPEVIVINDYGDTSAEQKKEFLLSYRPLAGVSAIKNERFFVLDYADLVESPRNPAAVSALTDYLLEVTGG